VVDGRHRVQALQQLDSSATLSAQVLREDTPTHVLFSIGANSNATRAASVSETVWDDIVLVR